jgi:hypothetical protein
LNKVPVAGSAGKSSLLSATLDPPKPAAASQHISAVNLIRRMDSSAAYSRPDARRSDRRDSGAGRLHVHKESFVDHVVKQDSRLRAVFQAI